MPWFFWLFPVAFAIHNLEEGYLLPQGSRSPGAYLFFAFNLDLLINVFFPHIAATVLMKRYCPGLFTGIFILAPVTVSLLLYGRARDYFGVFELCLVTV